MSTTEQHRNDGNRHSAGRIRDSGTDRSRDWSDELPVDGEEELPVDASGYGLVSPDGVPYEHFGYLFSLGASHPAYPDQDLWRWEKEAWATSFRLTSANTTATATSLSGGGQEEEDPEPDHLSAGGTVAEAEERTTPEPTRSAEATRSHTGAGDAASGSMSGYDTSSPGPQPASTETISTRVVAPGPSDYPFPQQAFTGAPMTVRIRRDGEILLYRIRRHDDDVKAICGYLLCTLKGGDVVRCQWYRTTAEGREATAFQPIGDKPYIFEQVCDAPCFEGWIGQDVTD